MWLMYQYEMLQVCSVMSKQQFSGGCPIPLQADGSDHGIVDVPGADWDEVRTHILFDGLLWEAIQWLYEFQIYKRVL